MTHIHESEWLGMEKVVSDVLIKDTVYFLVVHGNGETFHPLYVAEIHLLLQMSIDVKINLVYSLSGVTPLKY